LVIRFLVEGGSRFLLSLHGSCAVLLELSSLCASHSFCLPRRSRLPSKHTTIRFRA
jgi:hypothetical protein